MNLKDFDPIVVFPIATAFAVSGLFFLMFFFNFVFGKFTSLF